MTPKEKAEQLVLRIMYKIQWSKVKYHTLMQAKDCSLIAVDEILNTLEYSSQADEMSKVSYWEEVKQEIEKL